MKKPDAKGRFASTFPDDLQQLSVRENLIAKNEIRSNNFKYQMQMLENKVNDSHNFNISGLSHPNSGRSNNVSSISGYIELLNAQLYQITYPTTSVRKVGGKTYQELI